MGLLAMQAVLRSDLKTAFVYLGLALVIDMIDGTLARFVGTKKSTPQFDGALLDNIVDYFTYVIVPAFILLHTDILPHAWREVSIALICLSSAYQFSHANAKTEDHYFRGFPSEWNILVFYLVIFDVGPMASLIITLALVLMVFVPVKYLYPSRTARLRRTTLALSLVWLVASAVLLFEYPKPAPVAAYLSLGYVVYYVAASYYINLTGRFT